MNNQITNEQIDLVNDTINEMDSVSTELLENAKEEASKDHEGFESTATVVTNPYTGKPMVVNEDPDTDYLQSFEEMMADPNIEPMEIDESKVVIKEDNVINNIKATFGDNTKISDEDIKTLINLSYRVKNNEKLSYYNLMPDSVRQMINVAIGVEMGSKMGNFIREARNYLAGSILQQIVDEATMEVAGEQLQRSIDAIRKDTTEDIKSDSYWSDYKRYLLEGTLSKAKELEEKGDIEKADAYRKVHDAFVESYTMNEMFDMYKRGKLRVKKIDVEKFDKACRRFNFKYQNATQVINDIGAVVPVLDRIIDKIYPIDSIKIFVCAFIKYTDVKNMHPYVIADHTFMYYWINNIITLDMYNKDDEFSVKFRDELISKIEEFIKFITDKTLAKE